MDFESEHSCVDSDTDSDLSTMQARVLDTVAKRSLVIGLEAVSSFSNTVSPVQSPTKLPVVVDRATRASYLRAWRARSKILRLEARAKAILAPGRTPRLATKST